MKNELDVVNIRLVKEPSLYSTKPLNSPEAVLELMAEEMSSYDREVLCILNLKANSQVINMNIVSVGTINSALVNPREIFKSSILSNACAIIAIHNHPSGNIMPSREDVNITKRLKMSGAILGIDLLDHIIIGGTSGDMYSFKSKRKDLFAEQYHEHER